MQPSNSSSLYIPDEIIFEVLSKLPLKTLIRFCCVSKSWRNLITSDPVFSYSHLQNSLKNRNSNPGEIRNVLLDTHAIPTRGSCNCPKRFVPVAKQLTEQFRVNPAADINLCRLIFVECTFFFAGCCNGIVCLFNHCNRLKKPSIHLWNPVLNQCKTLPWLDCINDGFRYDVYFTRNPVSHDYQVVKISHPEGCFKVEIYSLSNNSWKQISRDILPPPHQNLVSSPIAYRWNLVVHNGFAHWCAWNKMNSKLCLNVLDINQEKIRQLSLPDCLPNLMHPVLEEFQGCLALSDHRHIGSNSYELWVMKEHGEHISCIKHIKASEIRPLHYRTTGLIPSGQILAASKERANGLVLYDPDKKTVEESMEKELKCNGYFCSPVVVDYVPSLVPVFHGEDRDSKDSQNSSCIAVFNRSMEEERRKNKCFCTRWRFLPECSSVLCLELERRNGIIGKAYNTTTANLVSASGNEAGGDLEEVEEWADEEGRVLDLD